MSDAQRWERPLPARRREQGRLHAPERCKAIPRFVVYIALLLGASLVGTSVEPAGASAAPASYVIAVLHNHPLAYWQFNDPAGSAAFADSSGNANTLPQGGSALVSPGVGNTDGAISVAGGAQSTMTTSALSPLVGGASRTLEAWFRTTSGGCVLTAGQQSQAQSFSLCVVAPGTSPVGGYPGGGFYLQTWGADIFVPVSGLTDGNWHYLGLTLSGTSVAIVIDGQELPGHVWNGSSYTGLIGQPFTLVRAPNTAATPLGIGANGWRVGLSGTIDEVAVYPAALPVGELVAHYNAMISDETVGGFVIKKTASPETVAPGEVVRYTITLRPVEAGGGIGVVSDDLSQVLEKAGLEGQPTTNNGRVEVTNGHLVWNGSLRPGHHAEITYAVRVDEDARGDLSNRVTGPDGSICAGESPTLPCTTITAIEPKPAPGPDLALTKTASTHTVRPGGQVTFELVAANRGAGAAHGVMLEDPAPPGLIFQDARPSQGQCTVTATELVCALGTIDAGGYALVQLTAIVATGASGTIVNRAIVWDLQGDPRPSDDTAKIDVELPPPPAPAAQPVSDLQIQLRDPRVGQRRTFTITVTNHGPDPARQVVVTFTSSLPLRIIAAPAGCTTTLPVRCRLGTLQVRGRRTLRSAATPRAAGVLRTAAAVTSASRDPHPQSSVAIASTRIAPRLTPPPPRFTG